MPRSEGTQAERGPGVAAGRNREYYSDATLSGPDRTPPSPRTLRVTKTGTYTMAIYNG